MGKINRRSARRASIAPRRCPRLAAGDDRRAQPSSRPRRDRYETSSSRIRRRVHTRIGPVRRGVRCRYRSGMHEYVPRIDERLLGHRSAGRRRHAALLPVLSRLHRRLRDLKEWVGDSSASRPETLHDGRRVSRSAARCVSVVRRGGAGRRKRIALRNFLRSAISTAFDIERNRFISESRCRAIRALNHSKRSAEQAAGQASCRQSEQSAEQAVSRASRQRKKSCCHPERSEGPAFIFRSHRKTGPSLRSG